MSMVLESMIVFDGDTISEFSLYSASFITSTSSRAHDVTKIFLNWVWHLSLEKIHIQPLTSSTYSLACIGYHPFACSNLSSTLLDHVELNSMGYVKGLICFLISFWVYTIGSKNRRINSEKRLKYWFSRFPSCRVAEN